MVDESTEADEEVADDGSGWAAFAEPAGAEPVVLLGALAVEEEEEQPVQEDVAAPEEPEQPIQEDVATPEPPEPSPSPNRRSPSTRSLRTPSRSRSPSPRSTMRRPGVIARRRFLRRKQRTAAIEPEPELAPAPKHVRVLPQPETAVAEAELPPWERGFDDTEERRP